MKIEIYLLSRTGEYDAKGIYSEEKVIVKKGSKIRLKFSEHVRGGRITKDLRKNEKIVSHEGITLQECAFSSPSTAAQFVMGSSVNGWNAWHVEKKQNLKQFVEQNK